MTPVLEGAFIVGYGNSLRGDDGVGREVALALWRQRLRTPALAGATIIWAHQLTPEMAFDIAGSRVAVFVDAACDGRPPGAVTTERLPRPGHDHHAMAAGCWEDISPPGLVSMAREFYGREPPGVLVTVGIGPPSPGTWLSAVVSAAVPVAAAAVLSAIEAGGYLGGAAAPAAPAADHGWPVHA
jgi:hydrogenase maturation protease